MSVNIYSQFKKYVNRNAKSADKYKIRLNLYGNDLIALDEILFLYRQARIYNIESEISSELDSKKYQEKREGIINFFKKFGLQAGEDPRLPFFEYKEDRDYFYNGNFIVFYTMYCLRNEKLVWFFIEEALRLFDVKSIMLFCMAYVTKAKEENKSVPSFIKSVLDLLGGKDEEGAIEVVKYLEENKEEMDETEYNVLTNKYINALYISNHLASKSKSFLVLADDLYFNISGSTFADFSVVSLQYYKVIETELKEKIIKEATKDISWGKFYVGKKYYKMSDFDYHDMTLGELCTVFGDGVNYFDEGVNPPDDSVNIKIYENIKNICLDNTDYMIFFRDITSNVFRSLFRNPPAHTEPLSEDYIPLVENIHYHFIRNMLRVKTRIDKTGKASRGKLIDELTKLNNN